MAKKTASRGRAKTAKKAIPKRKKARRVAKSARKPNRIKATKAAPRTAKALNQAQINDDLREEFVIQQGNSMIEDYFSSGPEHFRA
ncbi:MAG: hypothetical protein KGJ08_04535 [Gammaproteobacteria bacterium]|nr:hypothetical protein [Gammaproteobacteria bacterium]